MATSDQELFHKVVGNLASTIEHAASLAGNPTQLARANTIFMVLRPDNFGELRVDTAAVWTSRSIRSAAAIDQAFSSVFYAIAILNQIRSGPVREAVDRLKGRDVFSYGIVDRGGGLEVQKPDGTIGLVDFSYLGADAPEPFKSEWSGGASSRSRERTRSRCSRARSRRSRRASQRRRAADARARSVPPALLPTHPRRARR